MTQTDYIDGENFAKNIREDLKIKCKKLLKEKNIKPGLAVVLVGDDYASSIYVKNKHKFAVQVGLESFEICLPEQTTQEELLEKIDELNKNEKVHGIIVQLPLPKHISERSVINAIDPKKDVDGFTLINSGKLFTSDYNFETDLLPCTPKGCIKLIKSVKENLSSLNAVVIGRSNIVGKPVAQMLLDQSCTVTITHSRTKNLAEITKKADIVVSAVGIAGILKADMVKEDSIIIDVGINRGDDGKLTGDANFNEIHKKTKYITPVPGGVGPMTIACLLENTYLAAIADIKK